MATWPQSSTAARLHASQQKNPTPLTSTAEQLTISSIEDQSLRHMRKSRLRTSVWHLELQNSLGKDWSHSRSEKGIKIEAYHAPQFESNIISVRILSSTFDVIFSSTRKDYNACFLVDPSTKKTVAEYPLVNNMYLMFMQDRTGKYK